MTVHCVAIGSSASVPAASTPLPVSDSQMVRKVAQVEFVAVEYRVQIHWHHIQSVDLAEVPLFVSLELRLLLFGYCTVRPEELAVFVVAIVRGRFNA